MDKHKILLYLDHIGNASDLIVEDSLSSTNDLAKKLALEGRTPIVLARTQTAGRGRIGRHFSSARGGLYMSLVHRPKSAIQEHLSLTPLAALMVHDALEAVCSVSAQIKWPNDLLIGDKKIAGILTEAVHMGSTHFIVLGLGFNLTNPLEADLPQAGNLAQLTGTVPEPERLASEIIKNLLALFALPVAERAAHFARYRTHCMTLRRQVRVTSGTETIEGVAVDVDESGALLVQRTSGDIVRIFSGEATLR